VTAHERDKERRKSLRLLVDNRQHLMGSDVHRWREDRSRAERS